MISPVEFEQLLQQRLPFLQNLEEGLSNRIPVICTDLTDVGREMTTPRSLQHVGEQIVSIAEADWTHTDGLDTVVAYLVELAELWEVIFERHKGAAAAFSAASHRPYCLCLRSFTGVTNPIEVPGARAVMYINEPELDANFASTLMGEADWLNPVSCMHTDDMQLIARTGPGMPAFRVHTINWQEILNDAIASSGLIVFYVDGASPGVEFEIECIRRHDLESQTLLVHRGKPSPSLTTDLSFASVIPVDEFLVTTKRQMGSAALSQRGESLLRALVSTARTQLAPSERLIGMPCEIVDPGMPAGFDEFDPETSYFVTPSNASAFVNYVVHLPDSMLKWNEMSQDMRSRGIQPSLDRFNELYVSLRMAFIAAACLGLTGSIAATVGLLAKVTSMAKGDQAENQARVERYMQVLDTAQRFSALTKSGAWGEKIEAFRESILEDPFM